MPDNSPRIFISYSRKDGEDFATELRQRLERDYPDLTLWQDRAQMEGGIGWWQQIEEALHYVEYMVLVATPQAMASSIVAKEWRTARQQGVCIFPVQVPNLPLEFPTLPRWMRDVHFYDLDHEWETFIGYLRSPCQQTRVPFMAQDVPDHFVERPTEFNALIDLLLDRAQTDPIAITTALHGAGGFGKTTLAAALCHDEDVITAFDDGILWVTLGESPDVIGGLTKLYAALTGERPGFVDAEDAAKALAETLADKDCLIVLDDVWNMAHLRPFLRGGERCARLITTRNFQIAVEAKSQPINVDEMTPDQAVDLLVTDLDPRPTDRAPYAAMAARLGEWPLLLELANGLLRKRQQRGATPDQAVEWVTRALEKRGVLGIVRDDKDARKQGVAGTLSVSLDLLTPDEGQHYGELAIFPEDVDIPLTTLAVLWGMDDEFDAEELVERFADLSLLRWDMQGGTIRLHDVIREFLVLQVGDAAPAIHARLLDVWGDLRDLPDTYAWEQVAYHLMGAERGDELRALLLDYGWLRAKLAATDSAALIADYDYLLPGDDSLRLVQGAIRLSAHKLEIDKNALAGQLYGRLLAAEQADIRALLTMIGEQVERPWLRPLYPTLLPPGGPLLRILEGHTRGVTAVTVLPADADGPARVVSGSDDETLRIWDATSGECLHTLEGHTSGVTAVAVLAADEFGPVRVVSGSWDRTVRIWDAMSGECLHILEGYTQGVDAVTVLAADAHSPARVVSGSCDTLRIWDAASGEGLHTLEGHTNWVNAVAVLPADAHGPVRVVSGSEDGTLRIWDATSGECLHTLEGHKGVVAAVSVLAADADGPARVVSGSRDRTVRIWDAASGEGLHSLEGHTSWVNAVAVLAADADGPARVVSGELDRTVRIWASPSKRTSTQREPLQVLKGHIGWVSALAVLPVEAHGPVRVASGGYDQTVRIWDVVTGTCLHTLEGHTERVQAVTVLAADAHSPVRVVSGSSDQTVRIWDAMSGDCLHTLEGHTEGVQAVAVLAADVHSPARVASGGYDQTVRFWDVVTGTCLHILEGHTQGVQAMAVLAADAHSPTRVVSGAEDGMLCIWDVATGTCLHSLEGHTEGVQAVAVLAADAHSPARVVSGSWDGTVRIWDAMSGECLHSLERHTGAVEAVAVLHHPDNSMRVISVSRDHKLCVWHSFTGVCETVFQAEASLSCCIAWADGFIATGGWSGKVHFLRYEG